MSTNGLCLQSDILRQQENESRRSESISPWMSQSSFISTYAKITFNEETLRLYRSSSPGR